AEEWKRFYTETWAEAEEIWQDYQAHAGLPAQERKPLPESLGLAANPFLRVDHRMDLDEYCQQAARGEYWQGALTKRCTVAGTQAFILPDGSQHWCGGHAVRRPPPLGNVTEAKVRDNIRSNISRLAEYPNEFCAGCAGATCMINQAAQHASGDQVSQWLQQRESSGGAQRPAH
ncbi:MAG: SPASM domain-containing protein, partial [Planctomycetota bacterium]